MDYNTIKKWDCGAITVFKKSSGELEDSSLVLSLA